MIKSNTCLQGWCDLNQQNLWQKFLFGQYTFIKSLKSQSLWKSSILQMKLFSIRQLIPDHAYSYHRTKKLTILTSTNNSKQTLLISMTKFNKNSAYHNQRIKYRQYVLLSENSIVTQCLSISRGLEINKRFYQKI